MLSPGKDAFGHTTYERHQPEQTLLYQLVEAHYPALVDQLAQQGKSLPVHVHQEFEAYLKCGRLEHGFLRVRCDNCRFERLVAFSCKKRGFSGVAAMVDAISPGLDLLPPCDLVPAFEFPSLSRDF